MDNEIRQSFEKIARAAKDMADHAKMSAEDCEATRSAAAQLANALLELGERQIGVAPVTRALSEGVSGLAKAFEEQVDRWRQHHERWAKLKDNCQFILRNDPDAPLPPMVPR